jgi:hypothetical protein
MCSDAFLGRVSISRAYGVDDRLVAFGYPSQV